MKRLILILSLMAAGAGGGLAQLPPGLPGLPGAGGGADEGGITQTSEGTELAFNNSPITAVLKAYETLTDKTLILDNQVLAGTQLTLNSRGAVSREEATRMIESLLLLNNFTLVPGPDNTIKVLSSAKPPTVEGVPMLTSADELPEGDQVVSFYLPLRYVDTQDALQVMQSAIGIHPYGKMVEAANAQALIIADTTPVIRKAIRIAELIDVPPAQLSTEFIQLLRADAEEVVEALQEIVQQYTQGANRGRQQPGQRQQANLPPGVPNPGAAAAGQASGPQDLTQVLTSSQFYADARTNRILVITRPLYFTQIKELILGFDDAVTLNEPYVRKLRYVRAQEILPVLGDLLRSDEETQVEITEGEGPDGGGQGGGGGGGGGSTISRPDLLGDPDDNTAPSSAIVGKTRLVADKRNNSILVFGPPEDIEKTKVLIDQLDQRPRQIYLSTVIGSLRLEDDWELSVNLLQKLVGVGDADFASSSLNNGLPIFDPRDLFNSGAFPAFSELTSGLSIYGAVGSTLDYFVNALEETNRFKTISRPSIFTENNKKAVILSGERVAVPSSTLTNTGAGAADDTTFRTNIEFEEVVLKLEVIPLITPEGEINLEIAQINDDIVGFDRIDDNDIPRIGTQEVRTTVTVPDQATVVLGGLVVESEDRLQSGVPWLSKIPLLGYLFSSTNKDKDRDELVILIQPVILNDDEAIARNSSDVYDQTVIAPAAFAAADEERYSNDSPEELQDKRYRYVNTKPIKEDNSDQGYSRASTGALNSKPNRGVQERVSGSGRVPPVDESPVVEDLSPESDPFVEFLRDQEEEGVLLEPESLQ